MITRADSGLHLRLLSTLCSACPQGPTGCCLSPPRSDWSDLGRTVLLGGRDFLLAAIAAGQLVPCAGGLQMTKVKKRASPLAPRVSTCVYHGPQGCTISHDLRPATCNYFLCDDAYAEGGEAKGQAETVAARRAHLALRERYRLLDAQLEEAVAARSPEGPPWDAAFLDWLGEALARFDAGLSLG
ncbi:MAG: hypothetical protein ABI193_21110 [Minicystis sp.]